MKTEILIAGGGLAGAAAAIELARAGREVLLVERDAAPRHKVCGEFLSGEAVEALRALGVDPTGLGAASITAVRLCGGRRDARVALPFAAMSLTRRTLDEALLQFAAAAGARVLRGCAVERLTRTQRGWDAVLTRGEAATGRHAVIATGKHDLRDRPRTHAPLGEYLGLKMYFRLQPSQQQALSGHVELHPFQGGYAGLQCVEGGVANLCCALRRSAYARCGGTWPALLQHMLGSSAVLQQRLMGAEPLLPRPLAIAPVPYGFLREHSVEGAWHVGDQAAVIPSFTGDGMAIALHTGRLAAQMLCRGATAGEFQQQVWRDVRAQVRLASGVARLLVSPLQPALTAAVVQAPGLMRWLAARTRLRV